MWDLTFGYFSLGAVLILPLTFWRVISYFLLYHFVCQHGWEPFLEGGVHQSWHWENHWHRDEKLFLCQEGLGMSRLCRLFYSQIVAKILCATLCQGLLRERLSVSVWIYRYLINNRADNSCSNCCVWSTGKREGMPTCYCNYESISNPSMTGEGFCLFVYALDFVWEEICEELFILLNWCSTGFFQAVPLIRNPRYEKPTVIRIYCA